MKFQTVKRLVAVLGLGGVVLTSALPALAAPPPDVFKDVAGNVYIHGSTATTMGSSSSVSTSEPLVRKIRAGYCGEVRIAESSSIPSIGNGWVISGTTYNRGSMTSYTDKNLIPKCSGNTFTPAASGSFVDGTSTTDRVVITGLTPGISYDVTFNDVNSSLSSRPNACGFFRLGNTEANPLPAQLTIGSTPYTVSSLTVSDPPLCRSIGSGSYVKYVPATW